MSTVILNIVFGSSTRTWISDSGIFGVFLISKRVSGIEVPKCHCGLNAYSFINGIMHHTYHSQKNLLNTHQKRGNILFMSMFISYFFSSKTLLIYAVNILKTYVSLFFRWLQIRIFWS